MSNQTNRKGLIPSGNYTATVRQSYRAGENPNKKYLEPNELVILWTIDSNKEFHWRNLEQTFDPDSDLDMWNLSKIADRLNFNHYEAGHTDFYDQWIGLRAKLKVTVDLKDSRFKKNVILEHSLPERPAEIDVLADKNNSHFYENTNERQLPI